MIGAYLSMTVLIILKNLLPLKNTPELWHSATPLPAWLKLMSTIHGLFIEWGKVTVAWGTHQSDEGSGVLAIDRALAQRCDVLYEQVNTPVS